MVCLPQTSFDALQIVQHAVSKFGISKQSRRSRERHHFDRGHVLSTGIEERLYIWGVKEVEKNRKLNVITGYITLLLQTITSCFGKTCSLERR